VVRGEGVRKRLNELTVFGLYFLCFWNGILDFALGVFFLSLGDDGFLFLGCCLILLEKGRECVCVVGWSSV